MVDEMEEDVLAVLSEEDAAEFERQDREGIERFAATAAGIAIYEISRIRNLAIFGRGDEGEDGSESE